MIDQRVAQDLPHPGVDLLLMARRSRCADHLEAEILQRVFGFVQGAKPAPKVAEKLVSACKQALINGRNHAKRVIPAVAGYEFALDSPGAER